MHLRINNQNKAILQVEINGEKVHFDGQYEGSLEKAKEFYNESLGYHYIGSSRVWFCNGVRTEGVTKHFFVKVK